MSGANVPPPEDRHRTGFAALVLMLRELSHGLFADARMVEGRALVDGLDALRAKTKGNLSDEEVRFLDEVLYELHLAALKPPPKPAADAEPSAPAEGDTGGGAG